MAVGNFDLKIPTEIIPSGNPLVFSEFLVVFNTSKPRSSLPQVGCVRGVNTFPNHNQSLTRESLTRPAHRGFLVTKILGGDSQEQIKQTKRKITKSRLRGRRARLEKKEQVVAQLLCWCRVF
jgi:hypothetical protein